jgi:hypothetical protein
MARRARSALTRRIATSFAGLLEQAVRRYQNRAIETAQVIEEMIALAKAMRQARARGLEQAEVLSEVWAAA